MQRLPVHERADPRAPRGRPRLHDGEGLLDHLRVLPLLPRGDIRLCPRLPHTHARREGTMQPSFGREKSAKYL